MIPTPASVENREAPEKRNHLRERFLALTVFLTGAAVLVLEILGTRLLSPYFGSNLYVWSALISVTLIALSLGYWIGGKLADSKGRPALLDQVIAAAAIWIGITPDLVQTFTKVSADMEYRVGILSTALISFGPALFLLGIVTPVALKLAVRDLQHVGRSSGTIYACSTAGGIAGALCAGFVLFPSVSITAACHITALVLICLAAGRCLTRMISAGVAVLPTLLVLLTGVVHPSAFLPRPAWDDAGFEVVANYPSYYGPVRVVDYKGARMLTIDGMCHNAIDLSTGKSLMPHVRLFEILPNLRPEAASALLIGLGAGDIAKALQRFGIQTTGVEIDPVVAATAEKHFGLREAMDEIVLADGRVYLRRTKRKFDLMVLDAFVGGSIPAHLITLEAFEDAKRRMNTGGVLALNVVARTGDALAADIAVTLKQVFGNVASRSARGESDSLENTAFFASDGRLDLPPDRMSEPGRKRGSVIRDGNSIVESHSAVVDIALRGDSRRLLPPSILRP